MSKSSAVLNDINSQAIRQSNISRAQVFAWGLWFIGALFIFYKYMLEVSPSVIGPFFMRDFKLDGAEVGHLTSCYYYAYLLMQIPMGILLDRFGPRRIVTLSIVLCALGSLILGTSHVFLQAEIGRFITGIGAAVAVIGCFKIITLWFPTKRFAFMSGLMMMIGITGAVFGEAPLSLMVDAWGWHHALVYLAYAGAGLAIIYFMFVRDSGPYSPAMTQQFKGSIWAGLKNILGRKQTWILSCYSGLAFAPVTVIGGLWGVPFLQTVDHFAKTDAANAVSMIFAGFAIGGPILGWLSDRMGKRMPLLTIGTIFAFICSCCLVFANGLPLWLASALLFGMGFGIGGFLLSFSMVREVNPLIYAATALGFMNSFDAAIGAVSDPLIGHILDMGNKGNLIHGAQIFSAADYHIGMATIPLYLLLSLLFVPMMKETNGEQLELER